MDLILDPDQKKQADKLTNWQRSQWARAGYPPDRIQDFLVLRHWKRGGSWDRFEEKTRRGKDE